MLSKKEISYIDAKIKQYRSFAKDEEVEARFADSSESRDEHLFQARLNDCAADVLELLLCDLYCRV